MKLKDVKLLADTTINISRIKYQYMTIWEKKKILPTPYKWNVGTLNPYSQKFYIKNLVTNSYETLNIQTGSNGVGYRKYELDSSSNSIRFNMNYFKGIKGIKFITNSDLYILVFNKDGLEIDIDVLDFSEVNGGVFIVNMNGIKEAGTLELFDGYNINVKEVVYTNKNLARRTLSEFKGIITDSDDTKFIEV